MPFYGQEELPEAPSAVDRPIRTYSYFDASGEHPREVKANFIRFEPHHVSFWLERTDPDSQATLVLAETHTSVTELTEVTS